MDEASVVRYNLTAPTQARKLPHTHYCQQDWKQINLSVIDSMWLDLGSHTPCVSMCG